MNNVIANKTVFTIILNCPTKKTVSHDYFELLTKKKRGNN
jgi:hypothetical protein